MLTILMPRMPVWIGSNRVTSKNKDNIAVNEGTASFDPSTLTLTLNNVYVYADRDDGIFLAADTKLTLQDTDVETSSAYKPIGGAGKDKNCKVEVNNSRLRAETVNGSVNPVTGLTSFDLVDCNYADNGNWRSCASK